MEIAKWISGGPEVIQMEGQPLFVERLIYQDDRVAFQVSWRRHGDKLRVAECPMLNLAIDLAVRWASERNMFGDPPPETKS